MLDELLIALGEIRFSVCSFCNKITHQKTRQGMLLKVEVFQQGKFKRAQSTTVVIS